MNGSYLLLGWFVTCAIVFIVGYFIGREDEKYGDEE